MAGCIGGDDAGGLERDMPKGDAEEWQLANRRKLSRSTPLSPHFGKLRQIKLLILLSALGSSGTHRKELFLSSSPAGLGYLACAATYRHRDFPVRLLGVLVYLHVHISHLMDTVDIAFQESRIGRSWRNTLISATLRGS